MTANATEGLVLLGKFNTIAEAETVAGFLESHGIVTYLPDQNANRMLFHLSPMIGYIRMQVRAGDLESAKQLLKEQNLSLVTEDSLEIPVDIKMDAAKRASYAAVFGLVFLPVVFNLYSFYFMWKYYRLKLPASAYAKRRIWLAWFFNGITVITYSFLFSSRVQNEIRDLLKMFPL